MCHIKIHNHENWNYNTYNVQYIHPILNIALFFAFKPLLVLLGNSETSKQIYFIIKTIYTFFHASSFVLICAECGGREVSSLSLGLKGPKSGIKWCNFLSKRLKILACHSETKMSSVLLITMHVQFDTTEKPPPYL